jgi:methionyl aminopeptidase
MAITIKSAAEIEGMRVAGRLAAEVLDLLTPHVVPGVTTLALDRIALNHIENVQKAVSATVGYAPPGYPPFPASICTSINHQVCHGIPNEKPLKNGDIVNIDVTVIKDGWHGDTSRMFIVGNGSIAAKRLVQKTYEAMWTGNREGRPRRAPRRRRPCDPDLRRGRRLLGRARVLRPRHRPEVPRGAAGAALRPRRHARRAAAGHDLHDRADDQRRQARGARGRQRRLDDRHQGPLALGAVGAHRARHAAGYEVLTLSAGAPPPPAFVKGFVAAALPTAEPKVAVPA